jgi:hypothetical protein
MKLKDDEKRMIEGQEGPSVQKAMEFLVKMGEAYDAEDMVDISGAHILSNQITQLLYQLVSDVTKGVKVKVPTSTHVLPFDLEVVRKAKQPDYFIRQAEKEVGQVKRLHQHLGILPSYTCMPHQFHNLRFGQHVGFTDSLVVPIANSWYGARTNMETGLTSILCAITGKTPRCGLHLRENRLGRILIEVAPELDVENFDYSDYGAIAYWSGKILVNGLPSIPVYKGLSSRLTIDHLKNMTLSNGWHSGVGMFHIVGVTPEAPTVEAAFGGKRPAAKFIVGKKEIREALDELNSAIEEKVDIVRLGCPHCGIHELVHIARLLDGRKVNNNTQLVIATGHVTKDLAKRMGVLKEIEDAGGIVLSDACLNRSHQVGVDSFMMATSDAAPCLLSGFRSKGAVKVRYGKTSDCINSAIKGKWEGR